MQHTPPRPVRDELVLLAGRDPAVDTLASSSLTGEGFGVASCTFRALRGRLHELRPDVIILEAGGQLGQGPETIRALRELWDTPIIVLGSRNDDEFTTALILKAGADDYLRAPFGALEFVARVKAVLRRVERGATQRGGISVGPLTLDDAQHAAFLDGSALSLSPIEYRLLAYLIRHPNRVVSHADILSRVWGASYAESHQLLRVAMSRLRRKLGVDRHRDVRIHSIAGFGYRLAVEATSIGLAS
jgi:two-component system KDP operon response regulator KdpE